MSRTPRTLTFAFALFAVSVPALSHGQTPEPGASPINPGSVSVGVNAGVILGPGEGFLALGPNVTFNASRKRALQISSSLMTREDDYSRDTVFFYALQYRRTVRETADSRSYWTAGVVGIVEHERMKPVSYSSPNVTYTSPAGTRTMMLPPAVPVFGVGTEKFVRPRLAIRGDVVISFLVMRAAVGVSVPLGRLK